MGRAGEAGQRWAGVYAEAVGWFRNDGLLAFVAGWAWAGQLWAWIV